MAKANTEEERIIYAFENPKYKWRTLQGVAKEAGVSPATILKTVYKYNNKFIKSSVLSAQGEELFTTRKHFKKNASTFERLLGALKNRIA